jgi:helix-turn-helix protein
VSDLSAEDAVRATADPIHDIGSTWMLDADTFARGAEWGWANPFAFYFSGRGGVLGDVDPSVVAAALGWFNPEIVTAMWLEGIAVHPPHEAAARYGEAAALWGRDHLTGVVGVEDLVKLGEKLIAGAEGSALPLFCGWRAEPAVDDLPGRAAQICHTLREWRGGLHLVATTAAGLSPLEAILTNEGEGQARFFGWQEPFPTCAELAPRHTEAQVITDRLCAKAFETSMTPAERGAFAEAVGSALAAVKA